MSWAPFALALAFGLVISALLHLVLIWPAREPPDDDLDGAGHDRAPDRARDRPPGRRR